MCHLWLYALWRLFDFKFDKLSTFWPRGARSLVHSTRITLGLQQLVGWRVAMATTNYLKEAVPNCNFNVSWKHGGLLPRQSQKTVETYQVCLPVPPDIRSNSPLLPEHLEHRKLTTDLCPRESWCQAHLWISSWYLYCTGTNYTQ